MNNMILYIQVYYIYKCIIIYTSVLLYTSVFYTSIYHDYLDVVSETFRIQQKKMFQPIPTKLLGLRHVTGGNWLPACLPPS